MPEVRDYYVKQTRIVQVRANNPQNAAAIGAAAFDNGQEGACDAIGRPEHMYGNTTTWVRAVSLSVEEDR